MIPARSRLGAGHSLWMVLLLIPAAASASEAPREASLTLEAAIAAALQYNRDLARGQMAVQGRELDIATARADFDISAGPVVQASRVADDTQWTYGLQASKKLPFGTRVGASGLALDSGNSLSGNEQMLSVDLQQPLFRRFGRAVAQEPVHLRLDQYRAERRQWELQRADLVMSLVRLFESIVRCDGQIEFETAYLERLRRLTSLVSARERQGRSTRVDVLRMEVQSGETEARLADLRETRDVDCRELAETIGAALDTNFRLDPPPTLQIDLPRAEAAVATALSNRLDVAQAEDDADTSRRKGTIVRRNRWPDLSMGLSLRHTLVDDPLPGADDHRTEWFASAAVDGYPWRTADRLAMRQAELDEASASALVDIRRQAVAREVLQVLAECRRVTAEMGIATRNRKLADDQARLARRLYEMGRGDGFSLSDAETQLAESESRLLEVRSAYRLSNYLLLHAMGILVEHPAELKPGGL